MINPRARQAMNQVEASFRPERSKSAPVVRSTMEEARPWLDKIRDILGSDDDQASEPVRWSVVYMRHRKLYACVIRDAAGWLWTAGHATELDAVRDARDGKFNRWLP